RSRSQIAAALCLGLVVAVALRSTNVLAAEEDGAGEKKAATQPARELRVAAVDGNTVLRGFKYGEEMQNQYMRLREGAMEASRNRDQNRMTEITGQMQRLQMDLRKQMQDAITTVA